MATRANAAFREYPDGSGPTSTDAGIEATIEQDRDGRIVSWDFGAERLLGWRAIDALGRKADILIPERNRERHDKARREMLAVPTGPVFGRMISVLHRDGREFPVHVSIGAVERPDGWRLVARLRESASAGAAGVSAFGPDNQQALNILDQIEDGCSVVDLRGTYLYANDAFCRVVNRSRADIVGKRYSTVMNAARSKRFLEIYSEVYRTGRPNKGFEFQITGEDGSPRYFEQSVSLHRNASGKPIGFLAVARDCTARKLAAEETMHAREVAEQASRAKSEFLANMSHEIRTPMNGIIGMTDLALDTELSPYQLDCLTTVKASAESLLTILNDILDFSKIESRKLELELVPFSLTDVLNSTLRPLTVQADQKQLELIVDFGPDVPPGLVGDPVRLKQILTNLVGNAIKFTERGHVLVGVRTEATSAQDVVLRFSVTDTGIGIPREHHQAIFDAFRQADGSTTRRFGGTGLGLAIVSTLVQLMGGRITLESEPGNGSTFAFTAVFGLAESQPGTSRSAALAGVHVLIVDDNAVNRRIFENQVVNWGMKPHCVDNGRAALDALRGASQQGRPFSLVLLDANMPGLDGFEVAEEMSRHPELADATIMLLTSSGQYGDATRCRTAGIAAYLTKPVKQADLYESISRVLDSATANDAPRPERPPVANAVAVRPVKVLLAEDNLVNQRVAVGLLQKRGHVVTVANNGQEALDCLAREPFELVLMDVQMPVMGGLDATAAIRVRERGGGRRVRIVAMTAHAMNGDRERCLAAGMDGYVTKPIDPKLLYSVVEEGGEPIAADARPPSSAIDREAALELMGGDAQLLGDVMRLFLADCPSRLAAIEAAVAARDADRIRREAHGLKGASGNLAAATLVDAARTLEKIGAEHRLEEADGAWVHLSGAAAAVLDELRRTTADGAL
jgi:PAS domain S-box-containing protein